MATAVEKLQVVKGGGPGAGIGRKAVDYALTDFELDVPNRDVADVDVADAITDTDLTLTVEGASNLDVHVQDPRLSLLRGDLLTGWLWGKNLDHHDEAAWVLNGRKVTVMLDDIELRLQKLSKQGTDLTLTFEEEAVALLRDKRGALKVTRGPGSTRAKFIKRLADEAGVPSFIPELNVTQPIAKPQQQVSASQRRSQAKKGLDPHGSYPLKPGQTATPAQVKLLQRALDVADSLNAPELAMLALVCAAIGENDVSTTTDAGNPSHHGWLQSTSFAGTDVEGQSKAFLEGGKSFGGGGAIKLARAHPGMSPGTIATMCEVSGQPGSFYDAYAGSAKKIVSAFKPGGGGPSDVTIDKPFEFKRGANETSWDCIQRLAQEVQWLAFVRKGVLWYVSQPRLFQSAVDMSLTEHEGGVEDIDFEIDLAARDLVTECTANCEAARWSALPGMVVVVNDLGPATGRWIVSQIEGKLTDIAVTATLHKPLPQKPEPAPEQQTLQTGTGKGDAAALWQVCKKMSAVHKAYVWGGSHGPKLSRVSLSGPFDCSSSTSKALFEAGMFDGDTAIVSGDFASHWGQAGRGKFFTVWANSNHVFIELNVQGHQRFDTSQHSGSGPELVPWGSRSTAGFTPRHWKGQ